MEQRNEPTTAEIVATMTHIIDQFSEAYRFGDLSAQATEAVDPFVQARDRLEQLESDLETFKAFHERYAEQTSKKYVDDICALTARAEKAEAERDAAYERGYENGFNNLLDAQNQ